MVAFGPKILRGVFVQAFFLSFLLVLSSISFGAIQVESLELWVKQNPKASLEQFLDWITLTDPAQMEWFTLMRQSQSAQGASPHFPRAIVFGPEAKFIFTFNGHESQQGYQDIEMIFFKEKPKAQWEFRKLSFDSVSKQAQLSGPNPAACLFCHQNSPRPIWSEYDQWPGAYGQNDDAIPDFENDKYATPGFKSSSLEERKKEFYQFAEFVKTKNAHLRYAKLKFPEGSPVSPFSPTSRYFDYRFRPNLKLTMSLIELHSKIILERVKEHSEYPKEKYLLLASLLACKERVKDRGDGDGEEGKEKQLFIDLKKRFEEFAVDVPLWNRTGYVGYDSDKHHLLYLLGVEHTDFSLEKEPSRWAYFEGQLYSDETLMMELYRELKSNDSALPILEYYGAYGDRTQIPYGVPGEAKHIGEVCEFLLKQRLNLGPIVADGNAKIENPMVTCLACHSNNGRAPYIPFENRSMIKSDPKLIQKIWARVESKEADTKMPPTRSLSQKEKKAIREWLFQ